uniref:Uncharacterized protein n=1 Tax=Picea glauca TaxID=3330 RepID=A0A124GN79_PICGL|nr:hypothetical protein ABT39_MTgene4971 [Picea glauca]
MSTARIWRSPCFLLPSPRDSHLRKTKCALMLFSCSRGEMAGSNTNCNNPNGCLFLLVSCAACCCFDNEASSLEPCLV